MKVYCTFNEAEEKKLHTNFIDFHNITDLQYEFLDYVW